MEILFWCCVLVVLYTYFGYPLLLVLLSAIIRKQVRTDDSHRPSVTLLVAAYNEERIIEEKIRNSLALEYPEGKLELVVASDGSSDGTEEIAKRFTGRGITLFAYPQRRGKGRMLNESVPRVHGEIVVFSDASVIYDPQAILKLVRNFADPEVGGVWGDKIYRNPGEVLSGAGEGLYLRYEKFSKRRENLLGSIVSAEGSMLAVRREIFRPIPDASVADDYYLSTLIRDQGYRLIYEPLAVSYEDVAPSSHDEFRRKVRIIQRGLRGFWLMRHLANPLRTGVYAIQMISRQFLRRAVAALFPVILLLNLVLALGGRGPLYWLLLAGQSAILLLALAGRLAGAGRGGAPFIVYVPYYFLMVNAAALKGIWHWLSGKRAVTWEPTTRQ
jgi:cellulose synthase/poly-beta-1,6-N-acetylglucosamine synthase-like glycosyltransferase